MSDTTPCAHHQFFGAREFCPDCGLSRTEVLVEACAPFLKDGETPAECIASGERDATYAQLAEAQRFPHGAAAVTGCDMKINDEGRSNAAHWYERAMKAEARLQKIMARCADLLDEDQFNELDAMMRTTVRETDDART